MIKRKDLSQLRTFTIDPMDAKDFDDAVCLIREGDNLTLWVAIADVANYVHPSSRLDSTARARATSVYLPHAVLPMLPPRLADDLCSLRSGVDRLAMVISMSIRQQEVVETKAYEAVIRVKENLAYEDALDNPEFSGPKTKATFLYSLKTLLIYLKLFVLFLLINLFRFVVAITYVNFFSASLKLLYTFALLIILSASRIVVSFQSDLENNSCSFFFVISLLFS